MNWTRPYLLLASLLLLSCGTGGQKTTVDVGSVEDGQDKDQNSPPDGVAELADSRTGDDGTDPGDAQDWVEETGELHSDDGGAEVADLGQPDVGPVTESEASVLASIFGEAVEFLAALFETRRYFEAWSDSALAGAAFVGFGYGFDGEVITVTGFDMSGTTISLKVLSQWESWWFAVESSPGFFEQFSNLDVSKLDPDTRDSGPYTIDAVSGATYSSRAVMDGFWDSVRQFKKWRQSL